MPGYTLEDDSWEFLREIPFALGILYDSLADIVARGGYRCVTKDWTLTAAGGTVTYFTFTGPFILRGLFGVFHSVNDSSDIQNASFSVFDGVVRAQLTSVAGVNATGAVDGSLLVKAGNTADPLIYMKGDQVRVEDSLHPHVLGTALVNGSDKVSKAVEFTYVSPTAVDCGLTVYLFYEDLTRENPSYLEAYTP